VIYCLSASQWNGPWSLNAATADTRSAIYGSTAASAAALLGFAIAAVSILSTLGDGPRVRWLREQDAFKKTRLVFMSAIRALGAAALVFTGLILLDAEKDGNAFLQSMAFALLVLVTVRLVWLIWLLNEIVSLALKDQSKSDMPQPFSEPLDDPD
jgi:hypothetical protein